MSKTKKKKPEKRTFISFSCPDSLKKDLELLSGKENRKLAAYVKIILNRHLREKEVRA